MWCAAGELLKTNPLVPCDDDDWDDLGARIGREKLSEPPLWSTDLLTPTPLIVRNWRADTCPLEEWTVAVGEADHRAELFPEDQPRCVVVDGYGERRMRDRIEIISVSSALVDPITGSALLRALQTMDDAWDYKLPDEGEDHEIDQGPYCLIGWLCSPSRDNGIDDDDPLRGYASIIKAFPGHRVAEACGLNRDKARRARWAGDGEQTLMFAYEVWGEPEKDEERYSPHLAVAGRRLLAHKEQLQDFLIGEGLDLIVEVEVTRREREDRRYAGEEEKKAPEGRFDRLYLLRSGGILEIAEGRLGAWTGDRPPA